MWRASVGSSGRCGCFAVGEIRVHSVEERKRINLYLTYSFFGFGFEPLVQLFQSLQPQQLKTNW